jgi:hypothetical protein
MRKSHKLKLTKKQKIRKNKTRKLRRIKKIRGGASLDDLIEEFKLHCKTQNKTINSRDISSYKRILPQGMDEATFNIAYPKYSLEEQKEYKKTLKNNFIKKFCENENTYPAKVGTNNRVPYDLGILASIPTEVKSIPTEVNSNPRILEPKSLGTSTTQSVIPIEDTNTPKCEKKCKDVKGWRTNPACKSFFGFFDPNGEKMIKVDCQ